MCQQRTQPAVRCQCAFATTFKELFGRDTSTTRTPEANWAVLDTSTHCVGAKRRSWWWEWFWKLHPILFQNTSARTRRHSFRNSDPAISRKKAQWQARWREGCGGELAHGSAVRRTSSVLVRSRAVCRLTESMDTMRCYVCLIGPSERFAMSRRGPVAEGPAQRVSAMGRKLT